MTANRTKGWGVSRAAAYLHLSPDTIRYLFDTGVLVGHRTPGGHRRIDATHLDVARTLRVSQTAAALGCSAGYVRTLFDTGVLWGHRTPTGHRRIDPASVIAYKQTVA